MRRLQYLGDSAADHHLAAESAHRLDLEVSKVLGNPLGGQFVRSFRLLRIMEDRDRRDGSLSGSDRLVRDEPDS